MKFARIPIVLAGLALAAPAAFSQVSTLAPWATFPNERIADTTLHLNLARDLAGDDLYPYFAQRCILDAAFPILDDLMQQAQLVQPTRVFTDLYFVGQNGVSAWAVQTSEGLVIFDSLNNADEAENILVAGVRAMGFAPTDIKYVVVTHEHRDHFGGAKYLQDTYGATVVASNVAWNAMATQSGAPVRQMTVADGQSWTFGGKTFQFYATPGHTDGALSTIIPVLDVDGSPHVAALYGGFGVPGTVANKIKQISSLRYFGQATQRAGVDVIIGNHQVQDQSLYKMDMVRHRRAGDLNPFVIEKPAVYTKAGAFEKRKVYSRFLQMQEQCVRTAAGRVGQVLPD